MLKTEIGREQLGLALDNLSAVSNAYFRIFIFLSPMIYGIQIDENEIDGVLFNMKFENVYFINGTAYAGKSTIVKALADKHDGIACEENYHDTFIADLDSNEFPSLTYTRDLVNWSDFIRRTPDEYEAWVNGCIRECTILELTIEESLSLAEKVFRLR